MYIKSIKYSGLRALADFADLTFRYPGDGREDQRLPNVNVFTGRNGSGKTTLLQAITAGLQGSLHAGLIARSELRRSTIDKAELTADRELDERDVKAGFAAQEHLKLSLSRRSYPDVDEFEAQPTRSPSDEHDRTHDDGLSGFVAAYGATRWAQSAAKYEEWLKREKENGKHYSRRRMRIQSLFDHSWGMMPPPRWNRNPDDESFFDILDEKPADERRRKLVAQASAALSVVRAVLEDRAEVKQLGHEGYSAPSEELKIALHGHSTQADRLPGGYQSVLGWLCDLLGWLTFSCPEGESITAMTGVVLVDEIELHLHPEWQRCIVPAVAHALPNIQFILTTHSPLVVGSVHISNVWHLDDDGSSLHIPRQSPSEGHGLNPDRILLGAWFGLHNLRPPDEDRELKRLAEAARTGDPKAARDFLRILAGRGDQR